MLPVVPERPLDRYLLGDVDFKTVLEAATKPSGLDPAYAAQVRKAQRRRLCTALFNDGARLRAEGQEAQCLERMREVSLRMKDDGASPAF